MNTYAKFSVFPRIVRIRWVRLQKEQINAAYEVLHVGR